MRAADLPVRFHGMHSIRSRFGLAARLAWCPLSRYWRNRCREVLPSAGIENKKPADLSARAMRRDDSRSVHESAMSIRQREQVYSAIASKILRARASRFSSVSSGMSASRAFSASVHTVPSPLSIGTYRIHTASCSDSGSINHRR